MSSGENDRKLLRGAFGGNLDAVKDALEAGANVNGHREQHATPIVAAATAGHSDMVDFLLEQGADPDSGAPGERALHIAATSGQVEIVRLLLESAGADPNATDHTGRTPLMAISSCPQVCVEGMRLLLEAGADPVMAEKTGFIPLHFVATKGHTDLVDMLLSRAPATLNLCSSNGMTPLYLACDGGHASLVSKLLSLGAMQRVPLTERDRCPLEIAVIRGVVDVVQVLINEGGIRAVGGEEAFTRALCMAASCRHPRILRLLLTVDGEERVSDWANKGNQLLHCSAGCCSPAAASILLAAGADEAARDPEGHIPQDVIGLGDGQPPMDRGDKIAIRRMLQRGPAYRARSWAWPSDKEADAGGHGDGDTAAAAASAAVPSSPPAVQPPPVICVRIFRPKENSGKFFVKLIGRYCAKD